MSVDSASMVVVVDGLRLLCLSTVKPSERTGKLWQRLPCLSAAKSSEQTGKPTEMVKTGWSYCPLCVCLQAVCFDDFVRTVRHTPTLRMQTSNGS